MQLIRIFVNGKKCLVMKQIYAILLVVFAIVNLKSQTTISTGYTVNTVYNNGYTFNISNTNSYPIKMKGINVIHPFIIDFINPTSPLANVVQVWYKTSAVNGAPGAISTANSWTLAGYKTFFGYEINFYDFFKDLNIEIPANSTYGIYITSNYKLAGFSIAAGVKDTFSNGGVSLLTGNLVSYAGLPTGPTTNLAGMAQNITFDVPNACSSKPTAGKITGITGFCNAATANNRFFMLENYSMATGLTFQWQSATTLAGAYTNLGTNATILNNNVAGNRFYRCIVTCTATSQADTTPVLADTLKNTFQCGYCTINGTNADDTRIDSVRFLTTAIGAPSPTFCQVYTDNRHLPAPKIRAGQSFNVDVFNGSCTGSFFTFSDAVFLDFNRNLTYETTDRVGFHNGMPNTGGQVLTSNVSIPWNNAEGVTGMRVILQESATAPTTACTTFGWGEAEDYLVEITRDTIDVRMNGLDSNYDGCSLGNVYHKFSASNAGISNIVNPSFSYSVNGSAPVTETFTTTIAKNNTVYLTFTTPYNASTPGIKVLKIWSNDASDTFKKNDTLTISYNNFPTPPTPTPIHDTVCVGAAQTILRCPSLDSFMTRWYTDATGLNPIGTGNQLIISNPTTNITRYAKSVYTQNGNVGPVIPTLPETNVAGVGQGLIFDVLRNRVRINSVKMKFASGGIGAIEIRTAANVLLTTVSFIVPVANVTQTIPIGFDLPIGTGYRMVLSTNPGLTIASTGYTAFPQRIPNVVSITGSTVANQYNFFYDWNVTYDACESPLIAVNSVYMSGTNSPTRTLFKDTFFCEYPDVYLDANNNLAGTTYKWHDNTTGRTIKVNGSGLYIVEIRNSIGCKIVDSSKVTVLKSPIYNLGNDTTICSGKSFELKTGFNNAGYSHSWGLRYAVGPIPSISNQSLSDLNKGITFDVLRDGLVFRNFKTRLAITGTSPATFDLVIKDVSNLTIFSKQVQIPASLSNMDVIVDIESYIPKGNDHKILITSLSSNATIASKSGFSGFPITEPGVISFKSDENGNTTNYNYFFEWQLSHKLDPSVQMETYYKVNSPGWYYGYIFNTNTGCGYEDDRVVSMVPSPNAFLGRDTFACNNTPITITAPYNNNYIYLWDNATTANTKTVSATGTIKSWVKVTDISSAYGCQTIDTIVTKIATLSKPNLGPDKSSCNSSEVIGLTNDPNLGYKWSSGETTSLITRTNSGKYILTVTEVNTTCSYSDTINLSFKVSPPLELGSDIFTCSKNVIQLTANPGWKTYSWSNGFTTNSINVSTSGMYIITATDSCGSKKDTVNVTYQDTVQKFNLPEDTLVCAPITINIPAQPAGNNILWSDNSNNNSLLVTQSGVYWVSVDNKCNSYSDAIRVTFDTIPTPNFDLQMSGTFVGFINRSLNAQSYRWEFGDDSVSDLKNPTHYYQVKGDYSVKLTVKNSCGDSVSLTQKISTFNVGVQSSENSELLVYPNPSSDKFIVNYMKAVPSRNYNVELKSIDGRTIMSQSRRFDSNNSLEIDLISISKGSYILYISDDNNLNVLRKVTVIK